MLNFPQDVLRIGGILGQDEHDRLGRIDGMNDLISIEGAGCYIPRGDPARNPTALERLDDGSGYGSVLRGIADEYVGCAAMSASSPPFAAAFSHADPPNFYVMFADAPRVYQSLRIDRRSPGRVAALKQAD